MGVLRTKTPFIIYLLIIIIEEAEELAIFQHISLIFVAIF